MANSREASPLPPLTQGAVSSKIRYHWAIMFMYSPEVEFPFSCMNLKDLTDTNFPFDLVEGSLDDESRTETFTLFDTQPFCLFAKIQEGE